MPEQTAAGPVIIEDGKVLLVKEQKDWGITPWFFPGGMVEPGESLEAACAREAMEEVGLEIDILEPLGTLSAVRKTGETIVLYHFLARRKGEITPGDTVVEWGWHDIGALPEGCAENVITIIEEIEHESNESNE